MGFEKVGTPAPVSSVTANCKCASCHREGTCTLRDGQYLCQSCSGGEGSERPDTEKPDTEGTEGQNGVS